MFTFPEIIQSLHDETETRVQTQETDIKQETSGVAGLKLRFTSDSLGDDCAVLVSSKSDSSHSCEFRNSHACWVLYTVTGAGSF